ncbi:MAG: hypothetical protein J6T28_12990 [Paludibacteraceae bacterium]|nr:hypothetical protein [Paludibacteraceae bacterium]
MERRRIMACLRLLTTLVFSLSFAISALGAKYSYDIKDKSAFEAFSGLPLVGKYGQVSAVKVFYVIKGNSLYFLNNKYYTFHYDFCVDQLNPSTDLSQFNEYNYSQHPNRKYLLANVNYYKTLDVYALEFSEADVLTRDQVLLLWKEVSRSSCWGKNLKLMLGSGHIAKMRAQLEGEVPLLSPSEVYGTLSYQAVSPKNCDGRLRFVSDLDSMWGKIEPTDVVVLPHSPLVLPQVAGVIVAEFQTPLSHLSILGQNRKIPVAALKDAFQNDLLRSYDGKLVHFEVTSDTFRLKEIEELKQAKKRKKMLSLGYDLSVDRLVHLDSLGRNAHRYMGHKACNFSLLSQLSREEDSRFKVPECAFAIPFYFYQQHALRSGAQGLIDTLIDEGVSWEDQKVSEWLKKIRAVIVSYPMDSSLVESLDRQVEGCAFEKLRFRSSTNAEDAAWFSGAGLYDSQSAVIGSSSKTMERAVKRVWASLWSYAAYKERCYYRIDQRCVFMGVLAHRAFPSEQVNGVAVTKNLYRADYPGFTVNAQVGNENVVAPSLGIVCDQFICVPQRYDELYADKYPIDIITQSNLTDGELTMNDEEINLLAGQLDIINDFFYEKLRLNVLYEEFAVDVEFKLDGPTRQLYVKQVRPYNN